MNAGFLKTLNIAPRKRNRHDQISWHSQKDKENRGGWYRGLGSGFQVSSFREVSAQFDGGDHFMKVFISKLTLQLLGLAVFSLKPETETWNQKKRP